MLRGSGGLATDGSARDRGRRVHGAAGFNERTTTPGAGSLDGSSSLGDADQGIRNGEPHSGHTTPP